MQKSVVMFTFSFFSQKYSFWANFLSNLKSVCLKWNLVLREIQIFRIQWWCSHSIFYAEFNGDFRFCSFGLEMSFLGKFDTKNQNFQAKLKFDTKINSNMQNSIAVFNFSAFGWRYLFLATLAPKFKIFV